jgi:hypothetical protein
MSDGQSPEVSHAEDWGVIRPDGVFVPMRPGEGCTSREVAEAWVAYYGHLRLARWSDVA